MSALQNTAAQAPQKGPHLAPGKPANVNSRNTAPLAQQEKAWLHDGNIMRTVFFALYALVVSTLWLDYQNLREETVSSLPEDGVQPILPHYQPETADKRQPPAPVTTDPDLLRQPITMALQPNGVFRLTGSITVGSAAQFAKMVEAQGEYIRTIKLNSPGGSVSDAIAISKLVRERGWTTLVSAGDLCASSCPIIFAGGAERIAKTDAVIGVHQIFATSADERSKADAIAGTQTITADITRHLSTMGVDPALWLHALETPPQALYYLTGEELMALRLATSNDVSG